MSSKVEALQVQMWIDSLPTDPVDVETGLAAIRDDVSIIAGATEDFVKGKSGVPDFHAHSVVLRYIAATAEKCRLSLQEERVVSRISMVARFRKEWPRIKHIARYIVKGH